MGDEVVMEEAVEMGIPGARILAAQCFRAKRSLHIGSRSIDHSRDAYIATAELHYRR